MKIRIILPILVLCSNLIFGSAAKKPQNEALDAALAAYRVLQPLLDANTTMPLQQRGELSKEIGTVIDRCLRVVMPAVLVVEQLTPAYNSYGEKVKNQDKAIQDFLRLVKTTEANIKAHNPKLPTKPQTAHNACPSGARCPYFSSSRPNCFTPKL